MNAPLANRNGALTMACRAQHQGAIDTQGAVGNHQ